MKTKQHNNIRNLSRMRLKFVLCLFVFSYSVHFNLAEHPDAIKLKKQINDEKSNLVQSISNVEKMKSVLQSSLDAELANQFDVSARALNDNLRLALTLLRKKLYAVREKGLNLYDTSSCIEAAKTQLSSINATTGKIFLKCREEANQNLRAPLAAIDKVYLNGKHLLNEINTSFTKCTGKNALNCMKNLLQNIKNNVQKYENNVKCAKDDAQKELSRIIASTSKCYNNAIEAARYEIINSRAITDSCTRYRKRK